METQPPAPSNSRPFRAAIKQLFWRVFSTLLIMYALLSMRYFVPSPKIKRNFCNEWNAVIDKIPIEDRAWPAYIKSLIAIGDTRIAAFDVPQKGEEDPESVADWHAWLDANQDKLDAIRRAAELPNLGHRFSSRISDDHLDMMRITRGYMPEVTPPEVENPLMLGVLLPHLGEIRMLARLIAGDATHAMEHGDVTRFRNDIHALIGMGDQCFEEPTLISQLVGLAIHGLAIERAKDGVLRADFMNESQLAELDAELARITADGLMIDLASERDMRLDIIQRFYSDDGEGGGHVVYSRECSELFKDFGVQPPRAMILWHAFGPVRSVFMPTRRVLNEQLDAMVAAAKEDQKLPMYRFAERRAGRLLYDVDFYRLGVMEVMPFFESLVGGEENAIDAPFRSRDMTIMRCEVVRTLIAIHRARAANGAWPASLESLVPRYLDKVPMDQFDGAPLRYKPAQGAEGLPLLYSVGVDGVDQGGSPAVTDEGRDDVRVAHLLRLFRGQGTPAPHEQRQMDRARYDWVIWPEPAPVSN